MISQREAGTKITLNEDDTVANGFKPGALGPNEIVHASATLYGTDIYFQSGGFWFFPNSNIQESTIEHEGLHNYFAMELQGYSDPFVQRTLNLAINSNDTTNIDAALKENHCTH